MDDLIRRHLVRLIESDSSAYPQVWNEDYEKGFCDAINRVLDLPSVDAVEVVRCKNCDNFQTDWEAAFANGRHYCAIMDSIMPSEGFCSYGERKTDE